MTNCTGGHNYVENKRKNTVKKKKKSETWSKKRYIIDERVRADSRNFSSFLLFFFFSIDTKYREKKCKVGFSSLWKQRNYNRADRANIMVCRSWIILFFYVAAAIKCTGMCVTHIVTCVPRIHIRARIQRCVCMRIYMHTWSAVALSRACTCHCPVR